MASARMDQNLDDTPRASPQLTHSRCASLSSTPSRIGSTNLAESWLAPSRAPGTSLYSSRRHPGSSSQGSVDSLSQPPPSYRGGRERPAPSEFAHPVPGDVQGGGGSAPLFRSNQSLHTAASATTNSPGLDPFTTQHPANAEPVAFSERKKKGNTLGSFLPKMIKREKSQATTFERPHRRLTIMKNVEELESRQQYILVLAKALLHYGAPSHRIEESLDIASQILNVDGHYVYLPGLVIVSFSDAERHSNLVHFVKADGHVALSTLHRVHLISRKVLHDKRGARAGTKELRDLLRAKPRYSLIWRCVFAFICAACISPLEFGGSLIDMAMAGLCSAYLQFLGIRVAAKNEVFGTVFEITLALLISFFARVVATLPGNYFCYNAISSAGIIFILPGFTILISSLELTSENILCGSVRMVYSIIYTLFLGFSLVIGSQAYLGLNPYAEKNLEAVAREIAAPRVTHGKFTSENVTHPIHVVGQFILMNSAEVSRDVVEGCFRDPSWPWYRQHLPWWTAFILVPAFSMGKSLANLQSYRSVHFPIMIIFSCATYTSTVLTRIYFSTRADIVSCIGAFVIGTLASIHSRIGRGTGFTTAVTGVLFLVPVALAGDNGLDLTENDSDRTSGVLLAMRMIQVAVGVTVGIFASQSLVYAFGRKKTTGRFTF